MKHALAGLAVVVLAAAPAVAQERPLFAPTRDVTIDYSVDGKGPGANQPRSIKMSISAGGARMRIEGQGAPGYMIMDRAGGHTTMVMEQQHAYADMPTSPAMANMFAFSDKTGFARKGSDTVAGQSCTVWEVHRDTGTGTACITADGLLLRGDSADGNSHLIATKISYGSLPDSVFQPPTGYKKMDIPAMSQGAGRPGMQAPGAPHP